MRWSFYAFNYIDKKTHYFLSNLSGKHFLRRSIYSKTLAYFVFKSPCSMLEP